MTSIADNQNSSVEVSTGNSAESFDVVDLIPDLIEEMEHALDCATGSWQYQLFGNMDEIRNRLESCLNRDDLRQLDHDLDVFIQTPFRRQMGRLRLLSRQLEELKRYLAKQKKE